MNAAHAKKNMIQKVILESIYNGVFQDQFFQYIYPLLGNFTDKT